MSKVCENHACMISLERQPIYNRKFSRNKKFECRKCISYGSKAYLLENYMSMEHGQNDLLFVL